MFNVSDKVVCVDGSFDRVYRPLFSSLPKRGKVYVVRECRLDPKTKRQRVLLVGIRAKVEHLISRDEVGFEASRFRSLAEVKAARALRKSETVDFRNRWAGLMFAAVDRNDAGTTKRDFSAVCGRLEREAAARRQGKPARPVTDADVDAAAEKLVASVRRMSERVSKSKK